MRISVKNWSNKVVSRILGGIFQLRPLRWLRRLYTYVGYKNFMVSNPRRSFLGVVFDGELIGDIPRSSF